GPPRPWPYRSGQRLERAGSLCRVQRAPWPVADGLRARATHAASTYRPDASTTGYPSDGCRTALGFHASGPFLHPISRALRAHAPGNLAGIGMAVAGGAGLPGWCGSNAHVAFPDFRRLSQGIRASVPYHLAALDDGVLVGQLDKPLNVFVYDQGCLPHIAKLVQALPDIFANQGGQPFGRFIKNKQFWV